jgi:hypothetical protein
MELQPAPSLCLAPRRSGIVQQNGGTGSDDHEHGGEQQHQHERAQPLLGRLI